MYPASEQHIPDGLLAASVLLNEKPRHGVASKNPAPNQGIDERNSTAAIGMRLSEHLNPVRQSERVRTFTYDSLSRLLTASNPESGAVSYIYDANSNLTSKTDARGIATSYVYDALNRMRSKTSAGASGIPGFNYTYGYDSVNPPVSNGIGRLLFTTNNLNNSVEYSYDPMGRIITQFNFLPDAPSTQITTSAQYDLAGNLKQLTYPDGQIINETWNGAGEVSKIADSSSYEYLTPATTYFPNGTVQATSRGNGVADGSVINSRQRVVIKNMARVGASAPGTSSTNPALSVKEYCYGPSTTALASFIPGCPSLAGSKDNGNILEIMDAMNGNNSQAFGYDNLNRLTSFANGNNTMSQTYGIDAWGNMAQAGTANLVATFGPNNRTP